MTGLAVVRWGLGPPQVETVLLLKTEKARKKELQQIRVSSDDQRRMREIWVAVQHAMIEAKPVAVAIEAYSPIPGKQGGGAWKVGAVTQMLMALCWSQGVEPVIARPADLRRRFLKQGDGTKSAIEQAVGDEISGAAAALEQFPRSKREHVADAIGYTAIAYDEMMRIRHLAGL